MNNQYLLQSEDAKTKERKFGLTSFSLKIFAIIFMLIDHISAILLLSVYGFENMPEKLSAFYIISRMIGRLAFPIFVFLLVEGFTHTKDIKKYIKRMFVFAVISQLPYNIAFGKTFIFAKKFLPAFIFGNVIWTLFLGLLMMCLLQKIENKYTNRFLKYIFSFVIIAIFSVIAYFIKCDRQYFGIITIGLFYLTRDKRYKQALTTLVSYFGQMKSVYLSLIFIFLYDGKKGKNMKYFFYIFYPLHLILLSALRYYLFGIGSFIVK